jgi:glyoxylase-like metal-dependent hydrolase (beta-lactamase superfamily II)
VRVLPNHLVKDGDALTFDGVTFQLRDMGPCESDSDSMWLTSIDGVQHAFVGDIVYNHTQSYLRDGHALYWLETLDRLLVDFNHATVLHTSHGNPSCGIEALYWQKGYIQAFLGLLKSMLAGKDTLNDAEKAQLVEHMKAFTENDKLLPLLKFEMDETIRLLAKAV